MKRGSAAFLLAFALVLLSALPIAIAVGQSLGDGAESVYLPVVMNSYPSLTPTNTPLLTRLYIQNNTGADIIVVVAGSGGGTGNFGPGGPYYFGQFSPGSRSVTSYACGGSSTQTFNFPAGSVTLTISCVGSVEKAPAFELH